jgi:hypothetical protein
MKLFNSPIGSRGVASMKNLKFSALLAFVLIALAASLRAEFLYVSYGKGLLSFSINRDTGALTKLPGTPTLFGSTEGSVWVPGGGCGITSQ